jgi:uncharacterized protein (DUF1697 family)
MPVYIALLRGINVGGHNKVNMAELRALCAPLKFRCAQTYVQSGNLVFSSNERDRAAVTEKLRDAIHKNFGCRPEIILRTGAEIADIINANPFVRRQGLEPAKLLVSFMAGEPSTEARRKLGELKSYPEEFHAGSRELYIYFPNGMGKSKFPWATLDKVLGVATTGRNWNTVLKLKEMAEAVEAAK